MAATDYQQLQGIRAKCRTLIKESDTTKLPNATLDILINDFYRTCFVNEVTTDVLDADFTQAVTATDSGEYSLAANTVKIERATFNGDELTQYFDKDSFFSTYRNNEGFFTTSTILSIGVSSTSAVTNSEVDYVLGGVTYTLATAETELSGDTVPQSKYGAWLLSVDSDGTITVTEADDNSTGYATASLAIKGISFSDADQVVLGYVTIIDSDSTFIPGTTGLDGSGVTDTYTDGDPSFRSVPKSFLVDGRKLYLRPKSNEKGLFRSRLQVYAPSDLSGDSDTVFNELWGNAIATGVAAEYWSNRGDQEKVMTLVGGKRTPGTYQYYMNLINRANLLKDIGRPMEMSF